MSGRALIGSWRKVGDGWGVVVYQAAQPGDAVEVTSKDGRSTAVTLVSPVATWQGLTIWSIRRGAALAAEPRQVASVPARAPLVRRGGQVLPPAVPVRPAPAQARPAAPAAPPSPVAPGDDEDPF